VGARSERCGQQEGCGDREGEAFDAHVEIPPARQVVEWRWKSLRRFE
jgi:hypothetical protein